MTNPAVAVPCTADKHRDQKGGIRPATAIVLKIIWQRVLQKQVLSISSTRGDKQLLLQA
jgi:hypothetical protein